MKRYASWFAAITVFLSLMLTMYNFGYTAGQRAETQRDLQSDISDLQDRVSAIERVTTQEHKDASAIAGVLPGTAKKPAKK